MKAGLENLSDENLVEHVRKEDPNSFGEIIARYQDGLLRYANYLVHDRDVAEDVVQQSFIKAFINLNGFDVRRKFSSWLYRIVHNEALNIVARNKFEVPMSEYFDINPEDSGDPLFLNETKDAVLKCLASLPSIYAEPLPLFFLEEKSYEEISDILRISKNTVGTRIGRAKALMKKICQQQTTR